MAQNNNHELNTAHFLRQWRLLMERETGWLEIIFINFREPWQGLRNGALQHALNHGYNVHNLNDLRTMIDHALPVLAARGVPDHVINPLINAWVPIAVAKDILLQLVNGNIPLGWEEIPQDPEVIEAPPPLLQPIDKRYEGGVRYFF
jgi:hypothetical protein